MKALFALLFLAALCAIPVLLVGFILSLIRRASYALTEGMAAAERREVERRSQRPWLLDSLDDDDFSRRGRR